MLRAVEVERDCVQVMQHDAERLLQHLKTERDLADAVVQQLSVTPSA